MKYTVDERRLTEIFMEQCAFILSCFVVISSLKVMNSFHEQSLLDLRG
jgi:hypothetical protein